MATKNTKTRGAAAGVVATPKLPGLPHLPTKGIDMGPDYAPHVYDPDYPPINRQHTGLGLLAIRITGLDRETMLDPNNAVIAAVTGDLDFGKPDPAKPSVISCKPGFEYATLDVAFNLAQDELERLMKLDLEPQEYFALRTKFGIFHEIHDDFYDYDSGVSLQPVEGKSLGGYKTKAAQRKI